MDQHVARSKDRVRQGVAAAVAIALTAAGGLARAADPADEVAEVIVTGSRIATSGFTTPTPVTVLGAETLEQLNVTNIGAGIMQLPAFRPSTNPTTNGWGSFNVGAQIVNLRGLGVTRNLVLVDSRRFAPVTREGTVDLNLIPSGLVERTDVVTGGASAAYGSDAIAGVVNVVLNKRLTGIKAQLDYGLTAEGDGSNTHASLAGGSDFAGGRGHFIIGGEFEKQDGIGDCFTRDWCKGGVTVTNAGVASVPGLPAFVRSDAGGGFSTVPGGVVSILNNNTAATAGIRNLMGTGAITFGADGGVLPYRLGAPASGTTSLGGDGLSPMTTAQLMVPVERYATFAHADYALTDTINAFIEGSYGKVDGVTLQSRYFGAPVSIYNDNPFVPALVRNQLPAASATPSGVRPAASAFNLAVLGQRRGESASEATNYRVTFGLDGKLGGSWRWDTYYQYAHTDRDQSVANNLVTGASRVINRPGSGGISNPGSLAYFQWATDAVYNPADAALPAAQRRVTCRALISPDPALRAAAAGCVPYNPFGEGRVSQAALDYVYRTLREEIDIDQHVVAANVSGELLQLWAGPLSVATGLEFRHDSTELLHDDLSNSFAYFQNFGADYRARQNVTEGYLEIEAPLFKDWGYAGNLSLNAAGRHTKYEISGFGGFNQTASANDIDVNSWKAGLLWDPTDWMRFRVTRSRDIRAPNFNELFQASASTFGSVQNRFQGGATQFPAGLSGGNPTLEAEVSHTTTVGVVLQPQGALQGLRLSADWYNIKVNGYIATPGGSQNIVDRCFFFNEPLTCNLISFGPNNSLAEIRNVNVNLQWLRVRGVDLEAQYRLPLSNLAANGKGDLTFRLLGTRTLENATNLFGVINDRAGETGNAATAGTPDWLVNLFTTYSVGPLSLTATVRYISDGKFNALWTGPDDPNYAPNRPLTVNDNRVAGATYVNLTGSWNFREGMWGSKRLQAFWTVNNLMDKQPPGAPQFQYPTNPVYFDQLGRSYRVGVRMDF
jgi:iron complex outermembrane recepter protein